MTKHSATVKIQQTPMDDERVVCEKCGIIYEGKPKLIAMKMRLHEKSGCKKEQSESAADIARTFVGGLQDTSAVSRRGHI